MIRLENLTVAYRDCVPLDDVNTVLDSPLTAVVGPSGSGKSTLLRLVAGLQTPTRGTVLIDDSDVERPTWRSAGDPRVSLIHQDYRLVPFLSVWDNLLLAAELRGSDLARERGAELLDLVNLGHPYLERMPGTLSGGEQQRVAIARALVADARVLVADEPTGALDRSTSIQVGELLGEISRDTGVQVLVATHDPLIAELAASRWRMGDGAMVPA